MKGLNRFRFYLNDEPSSSAQEFNTKEHNHTAYSAFLDDTVLKNMPGNYETRVNILVGTKVFILFSKCICNWL